MASVSEVKSLLVDTTIPAQVIDESLDCASALWLMSAPAEWLAGDLVLCHPPVAAGEVRAVAHPLDDGALRLTVVAHDRPGLLADTAAVLATEGLSVSAASAMSWPASASGPGLALHALTVFPALSDPQSHSARRMNEAGLTEERWDRLGARLQDLGRSEPPVVNFAPVGRAEVRSSPSGMGRCVVTVTAPDQVGLLWAVCRWFADHDVSIEAAHIGGADGQVEDHFIVVGQPDAGGLQGRLTGADQSLPRLAMDVATTLVDIGKGLVRRIVPSA
jgi:predicted amino acid-binding ACT domain protein